MCQAMDERLSTNMTEQHHQAGQKAGGRGEADQGLEEQRHGASPNGYAVNWPDRNRS